MHTSFNAYSILHTVVVWWRRTVLGRDAGNPKSGELDSRCRRPFAGNNRLVGRMPRRSNSTS